MRTFIHSLCVMGGQRYDHVFSSSLCFPLTSSFNPSHNFNQKLSIFPFFVAFQENFDCFSFFLKCFRCYETLLSVLMGTYCIFLHTESKENSYLISEVQTERSIDL